MKTKSLSALLLLLGLFAQSSFSAELTSEQIVTWLQNNMDLLEYQATESNRSGSDGGSFTANGGLLSLEATSGVLQIEAYQGITDSSFTGHYTLGTQFYPSEMSRDERSEWRKVFVKLADMDTKIEIRSATTVGYFEQRAVTTVAIVLRAQKIGAIDQTIGWCNYSTSGERFNSKKRTIELSLNGEGNRQIEGNNFPVGKPCREVAVWLKQWKGKAVSQPNELMIRVKDEASAQRIANALSQLIKLNGGKESLF